MFGDGPLRRGIVFCHGFHERNAIMFVAATVSTGVVVLAGAVFLACSVEMVEALTIVFAVGHTRGWRSALEGTAAALVVLAALVGAFGPALVHIPIDAL